MELLERLGTRRTSTGRSRMSYGLFFCPYCKEKVEKQVVHGKRDSSCGCYIRVKNGYHRGGKTLPLYKVWGHMRDRCYQPQDSMFYRYGGRGITICEEWQDPETFIKWGLDNGWQQNLQIDRINNDGDYEPSNCRFVTPSVNSQNRSTTKLTLEKVREIRRLYSIGNTTRKEIASLFGVSLPIISYAIKDGTWRD